jgi:hypothetical protein
MHVNRMAIRKFIREEIGCTCPDSVFESIKIKQNPRRDKNLNSEYLLSIGGKLLVYLVEPYQWSSLTDSLEKIFCWGREMRDVGGFNRFRLVVITPDIKAAQVKLLDHFSSLYGLDERLHLHIIEPKQLLDLH